ncbi:MAG: MgtC/SapB family protein [Rickettsiales bacterium]
MTHGLEIITLQDLLLRVALVCVMAFLLGYDRKKKDKPVNYQSYMIVAVISCLIAIMAQELYANFSSVDNVIKLDLGKVIAGILTGIGFLGAGAIIKRSDDEEVIGTATGAGVWASGGLGLMLGFGFYSLAILGFSIIWSVLSLLPRIVR